MSLFYREEQLSFSSTVRMLTIWVVVLLPFQSFPRTLASKWANDLESLAGFFLYTDEALTMLLVIVLTSWICIRGSTEMFQKSTVLYLLLFFIIMCVLASFINNVGLLRGSLAIFDYTKNLVIVLIFYRLGYRSSEFKKALILFVNIGLLVAIIGLIGAASLLVSETGLEVLVAKANLRFGLRRIYSVAGPGGSNFIGVYAVLVFWLLVAMKDEFKHVKVKLSILIVFIFMTISRQTWLSFFLLFFIHSGKKKIWFGVIIGILLFLVVYLVDLWSAAQTQQMIGGMSYRTYTYSICFEYFKNNPFFGVGPGMLGGLAVQKLWSPLYVLMPNEIVWFSQRMGGGLDQFWGRLFADVGIIGGVAYISIFIVLGRDLLYGSRFFKETGNKKMQKIGEVLSSYVLVLVILGIFGGINVALLIYPFLAFSSIYLYTIDKKKKIPS